MINLVKSFATDDGGAVTVDWVVLTSGVVGLGLAVMAVASGGVEDLSVEVAEALADISLVSGQVVEVAFHDFSDGDAAGWLGGRVMDMGGQLGELLVLGPGETAGFTLEVPSGTAEAAMVFDLVAGDSLDNSTRWGTDTATVLINGVPVAIATSARGSQMTFDIPQVDGTMVEATVTVDPGQLGGSGRWYDAVAEVTVTVDQPVGPIDVQLHSGANQNIRDEFWGVDNFNASVTGG
ncbi:hypothetical protein [Jannaschia sp. CCS1]|uniref:hypothetical protein n=1 Tax=Jannaschia sp. (strain CCS1) TaxID=290400 RepID=UPI000053CA65|nr:hypothetical protein [Jannaschia sp. CCS1]ABD55700.1 hypothetical protein Jann_2783 [Jannaschia sp. CCS1]